MGQFTFDFTWNNYSQTKEKRHMLIIRNDSDESWTYLITFLQKLKELDYDMESQQPVL